MSSVVAVNPSGPVHAKSYGSVPPATVISIEPIAAIQVVLTMTGVTVIVTSSTPTSTLVVASHPLASVTVTLYVPGARSVRSLSDDVNPFGPVQLIVYSGVPPSIV